MKLPDCASWNVWKGPEVEGSQSLGIMTLFIRSLSSFSGLQPTQDLSFLRKKSGCPRVWFCKEFTDWKLLAAIAEHFDEVCIEVEPKCLESVPLPLRKKYRIFLKVITKELLKTGDVVCVGPSFGDESFEIGTGKRVSPENYNGDTKIL